MKKLNLLVTLVLAITLFSCGSDDDSTDTTEISATNLVGKWQLVSSTTDDEETVLRECEKLYTLEYKSDGTYAFNDPYDSNAAQLIDGPVKCVDALGSGSWSLNGSDLTITEANVPDEGDDAEIILELTATTLKVEYTYQFGIDTFQQIVETYKRI